MGFFTGQGRECRLISSRECRTYAILIGMIAATLAALGALTGTGEYPRWFLALVCGWIFLWPLARLGGFMMNMTILLSVQELNPGTNGAVEEYRKERFKKMYLNSQFIVRREDLKLFLSEVPENEREVMLAERDMAQRVVNAWTYAYFCLIPVIAVCCVILWC